MGGKKKGFIDKKRSATFTLVARDSASSSSSNPLSSDRVFVRTDNHHDYSVPGFLEYDEEQYNRDEESSIFADAVEDAEGGAHAEKGGGSGLLEDVRREILELGLPDDGYNYLMHLREIRNEGGGSAYYQNPRARFDLVPLDVKVCACFVF
jgi:protein LTV1